MTRYEDFRLAVDKLGSQTAAARHFGVSRQCVSQILKRGPRPLKPRGRKKGSHNAVPVPLGDKVTHYNGPLRSNKTGLQQRGTYSLAQQQQLQVALKDRSKRAVAREMGYKTSHMILWLCDGSLPAPTLRIAVEFERRFGVRCVDWFTPPSGGKR